MQFDRKITISAGSSRRAMVWQAQTLLISELWAKLQTPARGTEPLAEYLELPDFIQHEVPVLLDAKARRAYDQFERDLLLEVDEDVITAASAAVLVGKLLQMCNGAVYSNDGHIVPVHDCKLEAYQDVTHRERLALDEDGKPIVLKNLPNNRLVNNLYSKMVDQKTNYSFGRPLSFDTENKEYAKALGALFGARFLRTMHNVGEAHGLVESPGSIPTTKTGSWLSGAFLLMRS